jgi:hypothetical protein
MATEQTHDIDWADATIESGTLSVGLTGSASKPWRESFGAVLALLGRNHSQWGEVSLRKNVIEVTDVQQDAAADLRHFLESIVQQVNSDLQPDDGEEEAEQAEADPEKAADQKLTAAFREFAED